MTKKSKEEPEQVHEHNRRTLRELLFDSSKWLSTQLATRLLISFFESPLRAAVELRKQMRNGSLPWATRSSRLRDGLPISHPVTRYPAPADLDAVTPESLIAGTRDISEGDNTGARFFYFVDLQIFNKWLGTLAEYKQQRITEKAKPQPGDKSKQDQPSQAKEAASGSGAKANQPSRAEQAMVRALREDAAPQTGRRRNEPLEYPLIRICLNKEFKTEYVSVEEFRIGFKDFEPKDLMTAVVKQWDAVVKARVGEAVETHVKNRLTGLIGNPPDRDKIDRATGRRK